jgi:hypothetical protein
LAPEVTDQRPTTGVLAGFQLNGVMVTDEKSEITLKLPDRVNTVPAPDDIPSTLPMVGDDDAVSYQTAEPPKSMVPLMGVALTVAARAVPRRRRRNERSEVFIMIVLLQR